MKRVYLDYASTTYLDRRVKAAMEPYWKEKFGNASSLYKEGREAKAAIDKARKTIADLINAKLEEIIFTSGGTEGDNLAILGVVRAIKGSRTKPHVITIKTEHHGVLYPVEKLEKEGIISAAYLDVNEDGLINLEEFKRVLRPETILVSVGYANNEIGTVQPMTEIADIIRNFRKSKFPALPAGRQNPNNKQNPNSKIQTPFFHTDACQAAGYLDMNVQKLGVDLMTVNGSKIYGPKGIGFLYVRGGVNLEPIIYGGGQEGGMRSGTENVPAIVGLAEAFKISQKDYKQESARLSKIRDFLIREIQKRIPETVLNGHHTKRLANNVNISVLNAEGESLLLYLDAKGVSVSTGSACTSKSLEPSHVIMALGRPYEYSHGSLRITLGRATTKKEAEYFLKVLPPIVEKLRKMSPVKFKHKT